MKKLQFPLIFAAVLTFCSVMVIRQFLANQSQHVDLREDFILLCSEGRAEPAARLYQRLIQELPRLPDRVLIADEQRLQILSAKNSPAPDLISKYTISIQNELHRRAGQRLARAVRRAGTQ